MSAPRIASLVPSATETLVALGLAPWLVARTGFCVHPAEVVAAIPKVGGTKDVNLAKLRRLAPTHVILNVDENRRETADALRDFDRSLEQAAEGLGASRWKTLARITLPLLRPSLVSAGLLAFISSFDEVVVALFLAGANMTLPKKMFDNIMMEIDPTIAAVSVMQILLVSVVLVLIGRFGRGLKDSAR